MAVAVRQVGNRPRPLRIGYRLRWRSDIWSTNRGAAEVGTPDIRPSTEDDIRHNATTQDKDLLRIIMPFRFRFHFHYRMLRKKAKQPFLCDSIRLWNTLPASAISQSRSVSSFRSFLHSFYKADKFSLGL